MEHQHRKHGELERRLLQDHLGVRKLLHKVSLANTKKLAMRGVGLFLEVKCKKCICPKRKTNEDIRI